VLSKKKTKKKTSDAVEKEKMSQAGFKQIGYLGI
jgi:hypothetical protein